MKTLLVLFCLVSLLVKAQQPYRFKFNYMANMAFTGRNVKFEKDTLNLDSFYKHHLIAVTHNNYKSEADSIKNGLVIDSILENIYYFSREENEFDIIKSDFSQNNTYIIFYDDGSSVDTTIESYWSFFFIDEDKVKIEKLIKELEKKGLTTSEEIFEFDGNYSIYMFDKGIYNLKSFLERVYEMDYLAKINGISQSLGFNNKTKPK